MNFGSRLIPRHLEVMVTGQLFVMGTDRVDKSPTAPIFDPDGSNPIK